MYYILHIPTNQFIYTIEQFDYSEIMFSAYERSFADNPSDFKLLSVPGQPEFEQLFSSNIGYYVDFSDTYSVYVNSKNLAQFCLIPAERSYEILC